MWEAPLASLYCISNLDTNLLSTLYHYILYHIYKLMTFKVDITKIFTGQFENVQDNLGFYRTI